MSNDANFGVELQPVNEMKMINVGFYRVRWVERVDSEGADERVELGGADFLDSLLQSVYTLYSLS